MEKALRRPMGVCGDGGEGAGSLTNVCTEDGEFWQFKKEPPKAALSSFLKKNIKKRRKEEK